MATAELATPTFSLQQFQDQLGRVYHQPVSVHSFTNKRFTVNFRASLADVQKLLPPTLEPDEIGETGWGMFGMCACDFWVSRLGWLPIPRIRNNDMLFRVSARVRKGGETHRAFYTISSNSSSRLLGFLGRRFSHFRKRVSRFHRVDDGAQYALACLGGGPNTPGKLQATMKSVSKTRPDSTIFAGIQAATDFVFNIDGSCGYDFRSKRLSFQQIDYPEWDMYFCHECDYEFPLLDQLVDTLGIEAEFDSILFMQNTRQTWGSAWLYPEAITARD